MPKYNNNYEDETTPKIVVLDESILFFHKDKEKTTPTTKQTKKEKLEEAKQNEERENFELIINQFMDYWYDRSYKHPGILYHLKRCEALTGFELYHTDREAFRKWCNKNNKVTNSRVRAPYPYNLPSGY
jgi:hypothetical protein